MNNFMNYIQPTIVKLSDSEDIPTSLHNNYMINLNIVGIKYFQENFIIQENSNGDFIMKESYQEGDPVPGFAWLLEESLSEEDVIDIPRAYIVISADLVKDDSKLKAYTINGLIDNNVFIEGVDGFVPGKDFFINETLYRYLREFNNVEENEDVILPNYLNKNGEISENFVELDCREKDYSNIEYYYNKNKLAANTYSEEQLNDFYATFASTILEYTQIDDETRATPKNQVYELVLKYFANHQTDATSVALNLILNTPYANLTNGNCGCAKTGCSGSNSSVTGSSETQSCYDIYIAALKNYIKTMLGDTDFYNDWFTILMPNGEYITNDTLIDALETLVHEFIALGYDLSNVGKKNSKAISCGCSNISYSSTADYSVLLNYLNILDWLRNCNMQYNLNKTKIYGEKLGEIFPYLQF